MEIIDRVGRSLGLSDKNEEKEIVMSKKEELPNVQPEKDESPIQPPPSNISGHKVVDFNSVMSARDNLMTSNNTAKPLGKSKITTIRPIVFVRTFRSSSIWRRQVPNTRSVSSTSHWVRLMPSTATFSRSAKKFSYAHPKPLWS